MSYVFISYSKLNDGYAKKVKDYLLENGFNVWIDEDRIEYGVKWWDAIVTGIEGCAAFVVIMTPESKASEWVQREVFLALDWKKPIFPLLLNGKNWPLFVTTQYIDVTSGDTPPEKFLDLLKEHLTVRVKVTGKNLTITPLRATVIVGTAPENFNLTAAIATFFTAFREKRWSEAMDKLGQIRASGVNPYPFDPDRYEQQVQAAVEMEAKERQARQQYEIIRVMAEYDETSTIWSALQDLWQIYPDYDPDKIADRVSPKIAVSSQGIVVFRDAKGKETPYRVKLPLTPEQEHLLNMIADHSTEPPERAEAGRRLAEVGDPRFGVGVDENGLPEFDWVEIPSKPFIYGSKDAYQAKPPITINDLPTFYISRYALTYAQYEPFVAGDGYKNKDYWTKSGWDWKTEKKISAPALWDATKWHISNHPVIGISWHEAMAFCAWLSYQVSGQMPDFKKPLSWPVCLPHEKEWERAARGTDGKEYPWGKDYISGYANINETWKDAKVGSYYLERTTAAGIYPQGVSPERVLDMSGNTWDWCLNEFENPDELNIDNNKLVVVRGGSWCGYLHYSRAAVRYRDLPDPLNLYVGCRVLCVRPPSR